MASINKIRQAEAYSHTDMYMNHTLFTAGSWLSKPVRTVLDLLPLFADYRAFRCLDLGSGVGRNSIPIAQAFAGIECQIDCVDLLELAVEKLEGYAKQYGVENQICGIVSTIDHYEIKPASYDLVLAISALEHVSSEEVFLNKLLQIREGVRQGGVVCLIINTGVLEWDKTSGVQLQPQFEVNMDTVKLQRILTDMFENWHVVKHGITHQKYEIPREGGAAELETDVLTWVVQKSSDVIQK